MNQTLATRARAESILRHASANRPYRPMPREQVTQLLHTCGDLAKVLAQADPADKMDLYRQLGLTLTYDVGKHNVLVEMLPDQDRRPSVSVRGGT